MSWAEFILRSIGFKEQREFEMRMVRQISYEVHTIKYLFGKKNPPGIDKYWGIGKKTASVSNKVLDHFKKVQLEYLKKKNGKS